MRFIPVGNGPCACVGSTWRRAHAVRPYKPNLMKVLDASASFLIGIIVLLGSVSLYFNNHT